MHYAAEHAPPVIYLGPHLLADFSPQHATLPLQIRTTAVCSSMAGSNEASSDDDAHAQHTHTAMSEDDVLSHSPARVCRAKADAIASGEATVGEKLREELGDLLSVLRGVDVFKALSDVDLSKIADSLLRCVIPAGEIVMRQGERSSTFYLIVRGTATVARSEAPGEPEKILLHLGRLSYFGERALLSNEPREATIRAESELELLYIQREAFEAILGQLSTISLRTTRRRSQLARSMLSSCDTQAVTEMEAGSSAVAFHLQGACSRWPSSSRWPRGRTVRACSPPARARSRPPAAP